MEPLAESPCFSFLPFPDPSSLLGSLPISQTGNYKILGYRMVPLFSKDQVTAFIAWLEEEGCNHSEEVKAAQTFIMEIALQWSLVVADLLQDLVGIIVIGA